MAMEVTDLQDHNGYPKECAPLKDLIGEERNDVGGSWELSRLHNSSRIVRVSRSSGGKDRHSKVLTSRGLRDRRIRLSLNTAIQFYDLQDRLGYDQPSKAVEWLIKAAADPISELPSLNASFSRGIPAETAENQLGFAEVESNNDDSNLQQPIPECSTLSDMKIGSTFHISRSKICEKSKNAIVTEKGGRKEAESRILSRVGGNVSFTELLTNGMKYTGSTVTRIPASDHSTYKDKQWSSMAVDYFGIGSIGDDNSMMPRYSITSKTGNNNYNLNFTISPSFQPNLSSVLPQIQNMPYPYSSSNSFFFGDPAPVQTHQLLSFDSCLQLCNSESRDWGQKEKMKD